MKMRLLVSFGVLLLILNFNVRAEINVVNNCSGYVPATDSHLRKVNNFIKTICKDEADCKNFMGLDPNAPWNSCLTIGETIILQDYTQTYGSFKQWSLLEDVIKRLPKVVTRVYRGTSSLKDVAGKIVKLAKGSTYVLPRFVSTSLDQDVAEMRFASGVVMIINAKSARDIRSYSTVSDEEEHILLSGTKLRVDKIYNKILPAVEFEGELQPAMKVKVYEMSEI